MAFRSASGSGGHVLRARASLGVAKTQGVKCAGVRTLWFRSVSTGRLTEQSGNREPVAAVGEAGRMVTTSPAIVGRNRSLSRKVAGVDLRPPGPQQRLGIGL
jgi:hypothetical protein